ncbi:MAG: peptidoglycan glycosyltransferase [Alicyclobacillus macrosporangiidus]|uniref:peptidoglycan D,D-transpeptidase FtsI family protein n=1 Tax=Alicyclobacillus macrosporangiidus TaxID=392015 RepID=UPI0026EBAF7B|nr:penicillin-binding transpeptidase domain-containing protein [Alicyclobacillus macrosporangiidus]MCL6600517.1 peptidoglycan glycosyltransferase [Alicyclobacillus macrosporangiidus]
MKSSKKRRKTNHGTQLTQDARKEEQLQERKKTIGFRVNFVFGVVFLFCAGLIVRLGYLQISQGASMRQQAMTNSLQSIPVLPARGRIYDANGNLLAYDEPTYSVYYTRMDKVNTEPQQMRRIADLLAPAFHQSVKSVLALMNADKDLATVKLFSGITAAQLTAISENQASLPGIDVEIDGQRKYPYGDLAGQVLGYVGRITRQDEAKYLAQGYSLSQNVGVAGLEKTYEKYLRGKVGQQLEEVNTANNSTKALSYDPPPVAGDNLRLTLDARLQADAQNAVMQAIRSYEQQKGATISDGAAVMLDVKTGGVLAMVSYPYLDPNWLVPGGNYSAHAHYLQTPGVWNNNAIQNPLHPGSTVKPANLIIGLENGVITPSYVFNDTSAPLWIGTTPMREDASYGYVNDVRAIGVSDDKFFYTLGLNLGKWLGSSSSSGGYPLGGLEYWRDHYFIKGIMKLVNGERRFGLGQLTGIDLPYEDSGQFYIEDDRYSPSRTVKLNVHEINQALKKDGSYTNYGSPVDLALMAFGQSQQFTPIELAQYAATIANNGVRLQPHLLDEVLPPEATPTNTHGKVIKQFKPVVQAKLKINPTYLKIAQEGMYAAANSPDGTAYPTFHDAWYKAAGKTGTADIVMNGQKITNSVFIGYAPYDHPQIAVAVMVPGAGWGATTAVPIAKAMMDDFFEEHHAPFVPKNLWHNAKVPSTWFQSSAYTVPETAK